EVFSIDNQLLFKSLIKPKTSPVATFAAYKELIDSKLFFVGNISKHEFGFMHSINGTTGAIIDDNRMLIDNLMAIFLLIENIGPLLDDFTIGLASPKGAVAEIFKVINSSQYWDIINSGFYEYNKSYKDAIDKYTKSNFYAVLANFLIHETVDTTGNPIFAVDDRDRSYEIANETMVTLLKNMWDDTELGFYFSAANDWNTGGGTRRNKFLDVNALGITTLIDYWFKTGMNTTGLIDNATMLYNLMSFGPKKIWNSTYNAYEYEREQDWTINIAKPSSRSIDIEANALMLMACLKLYDATGNITYYQKAIKLKDFFEDYLYDKNVKAYNTSINELTGNNNEKNFYKNLRLCEALLEAKSFYNSTTLHSNDNGTGDPAIYLINQDTMKITSNFTLERNINYYNQSINDYEIRTVEYNITDVNVTYIFKYPNQTIFKTVHAHIRPNVTSGFRQEKTKVSCIADVNNSLNGTYFLLNTPKNRYYVWINSNNTATPDPSISGRIGIEVENVTINMTANQVAYEVRTILENYQNGTIFKISQKTQQNFTITNIEYGLAANVTDGIGVNATGFFFEVLRDGINMTVVSHTLLYKIPEDLPQSVTFGVPDYHIIIFANTTYYGFAADVIFFRVSSGLSNQSILGIDPFEPLYQGQTTNITLEIESTRNQNITMNITMEGDGILTVTKLVNITTPGDTRIEFNVTAVITATPGYHVLKFTIKRGNIVYLLPIPRKAIKIADALIYTNLMYHRKIVSGNDIQVSLNLINNLPNNSQIFNISFSGTYIQNDRDEISLIKKEIKTVSFDLILSDNVAEDFIEIEMKISKNKTILYTKTLEIEIVPKFEIVSFTAPQKVSQGDKAFFIIVIQNNQEIEEDFSLFFNGEEIIANIDTLGPGENRVIVEIVPTYNPYEFGTKKYDLVLK
ncbi:MAG: hypothetical protein ACXAC7_23070, partial [Candidatus Hodarchaeales archaeon]